MSLPRLKQKAGPIDAKAGPAAESAVGLQGFT